MTMAAAVDGHDNLDVVDSALQHSDTVTEYPVDGLANELLATITRIKEVLSSVSSRPSSSSGSNAILQSKIHSSTNLCDDIATNIQSLHAFYMLVGGERHHARICMDSIVQIALLCNTLYSRLKISADTDLLILDVLSIFDDDASSWIQRSTDTIQQLDSLSANPDAIGTLPSKSNNIEDKPEVPRAQTITIPANEASPELASLSRLTISPPVFPGSTLCPVQRELERSGINTKPTCSLEVFIEWTKEYLVPSNHERIGSIRSVHLFRRRKAPLFHEYALISLGGHGIPESWVRLERAARQKDHWYFPATDTFQPLFQGVSVRESVSFAASKFELSYHSDELASLEFAPVSSFDHGMPLNELADELLYTSDTYPAYQLFSANCRWFARQILFNAAQRVEMIGRDYHVVWKGEASSIEYIGRKLRKERFGGQKLDGPKNDLLEAENQITIAMTLILQERSDDASALLSQTLASLEPVKLSPFRQYLVAYAMFAQGDALVESGRFADALERQRNASAIARELPSSHGWLLPHVLRAYAWSLCLLDRTREAIPVQEEVVQIFRRIHVPKKKLNKRLLASSLRDLEFFLREAPERLAYALEIVTEALNFTQEEYNESPDTTRARLAATLSSHASVMLRLGPTVENISSSRESVRLTRELYAERPESFRIFLGHRLYNLCTHLNDVQLNDEAFPIAEEVISLYRVLYRQDPERHRPDLANALGLYSHVLRALGRGREARDAVREAIVFTRYMFERDNLGHQSELARRLHNLGYILLETNEPTGALTATEEALGLLRTLPHTDENAHQSRLAITLELYANILFELDRGHDAEVFADEAVSITRELYEKDPESTRANLASRLYNLAFLLLSDNRLDDGIVIAEEAVAVARAMYARDETAYVVDLAEALELYRKFLHYLGRRPEAQDVAREIVVIVGG